MRRSLAGFAVGALAGCGFLVDTGGLAGEGAAQDAGSDARTVEPATDAAAPPDAAAGRFCDRAPHAFCADFDGDALREGWTSDSEEVGGTLSLVNPTATHPSRALLAKMPRRETAKGYASLGKTLDIAWRRVVMSFDVYVERPAFLAGDSNAGLICFAFYAGSEADGTCMSVASEYVGFGVDKPPLRYDSWLHATFDVDPIAKIARAEVDGVVFEGPVSVPASGGAQRIEIQLGVLGYNVPAPAFAATYDDITIDLP